jgi:hypothetical protein
MAAKDTYTSDLNPLLTGALGGDAEPLEAYLMAHSHLPGPRANLELAHVFADRVASIVSGPASPGDAMAALLDRWADFSLDYAPPNQPREMLPCCAALSYGAVAAARPDWWSDEMAKVRRCAADGRWRVREMAATGLQKMLQADWRRTCNALVEWASDPNPLVVRAAVAAVAEPPLLKDRAHAEDAVTVQAEAVNAFLNVPAEQRRDDDARALRQALGYTLSVVTAAAPEAGFHLMEELAALPDADMIWVIRENLKKKRLQSYSDRLETIEIAIFRPE